MSTKVDLDELERLANVAMPGFPLTVDDWKWFNAMDPATGMALVGRIRELERLCAMLINDHVGSDTYRAELFAELKKGATLP